ncbi:MAG: hypothetical protein IPO09_05665 [Anaeromyxobacter sp.]|nr:hypothetical protein [Anaeromyxobacter sp.]
MRHLAVAALLSTLAACGGGASTPPAAMPVVLGVSPASPANQNAPVVSGTGPAGATLELFADAACAGVALGSGTVAADGAFAVVAAVADDTSLVLRARATGPGGASPCSTTSVAYQEDSTAPGAPTLLGPPGPGNADQVSLSGAAEPGATVQVFQAADCAGAAVASGVAVGGAWAAGVAAPPDALTTWSARALDQAGNPGPCSAPHAFLEDSTAPAAPEVAALLPASPADDNAPLLAGTAEPGATVRVHTGGGCDAAGGAALAATVAADQGGAWSTPVAVPDDALTTFGLEAVDAAGNRSACDVSRSYLEDSTAPAAPSLTASPASPANQNAPVLSGQAEPLALVALFAQAGCAGAPLATAPAGPDGAWSIQAAVADDATTTFSARASDAAGHPGACSAAATYVEDSTPPPAATLGGPSGPSSANLLALAGLAEPFATVHLHLGAACPGAPAATATADAGGAWTAALPVPDDALTLTSARAVDAAGNAGPCSAEHRYLEDSTAPARPSVAAVAPSPANDNAPVLSGAAEPGATVRVYTGGGCSPLAGAALVATAAADPASGAWTTPAPVPDDALTTFGVEALDAAGNTSPCDTSRSYLEDSTPPAAPSLTLAPPSPANDNAPALSGAAEAGAAVALFAQAGCAGAPLATVTATGGAWSVQAAVADDSTTTFSARASDAAGNAGACSAGATYQEDSTAPAAPTLAGPAGPANQNVLPLTGVTEPFATVRVHPAAACAGAPAGAVTADAAGAWAFDLTVLDDQATTTSVSALDRAGNAGPCSADHTYLEDSTPPAQPSVLEPLPASPANGTVPLLAGAAEAGATVRLYRGGSCSPAAGAVLAATTQAHPATGAWSTTVTVPANTRTTFGVEALDAAGNASPCDTSRSYLEDSAAPAAPSLAVAPPSPANDNAPLVAGLAEPGSQVAVFLQAACAGGPVATMTATAGTGLWSIQVAVPDDTTTSFSARASDAAGNLGPCSASAAYVEDSTPPPAPTLAGPTGPANQNLITLSGLSEPGATVRLHLGAGCAIDPTFTLPADAAGAWSLELGVDDDVTRTFSASAGDAAGNVGACSPPLVYVEDSSVARPVIAGSTPPSPSASRTPIFGGTAEAGATVRLHLDAACAGPVAASGAAGPAGTFSLTATVPADAATSVTVRATDLAGNLSACSAPFTYVHAGVPPALALALPAGPVGGLVTVSATATAGDSPVARVEFEVGGALTTRLAPGPYDLALDTRARADGPLLVTATAVDLAGNRASQGGLLTVDNTPPAFQAAASSPLDGDLLSLAEASAALAPARFAFVDRDLDEASVGVAITYQGRPLLEGLDFTVSRAAAGQVEVALDVLSLRAAQDDVGLRSLVFTLGGAADTTDTDLAIPGVQPNRAAEVVVAVGFDALPPGATVLRAASVCDGGACPRTSRAVALFDEQLDPASLAGFTFARTLPAPGPVAPDPDGGLGLSFDGRVAWYVPDQLLEPGASYAWDVAGLTDLAGNAAFPMPTLLTVAAPPAPPALLRVEVVDALDPLLVTVLPAAPGAPGFTLPAGLAGTLDQVRLVFDQPLTGVGGELREGFEVGGCRSGAALASVAPGVDNAVSFDPAASAAGAGCPVGPWGARRGYLLRTFVSGAGGGASLERGLVVAGGDELEPPALVALGGGRLAGTARRLRPEEPLLLAFSEPIDPGGLAGASFTLSGGLTAAALTPTWDPRRPELVRLRADRALAAGDYAVEVAGLTDVARPAAGPAGNPLPPTSATFTVAALRPGQAPFLISATTGGIAPVAPWAPITLSFTDAVVRAGLSDTGPVRGLRAEQQVLGSWIPLKGLVVQGEGPLESAHLVLTPEPLRPFDQPGVYRVVLAGGAAGLRSADGVPLSAPLTLPFLVGTAGTGPAFRAAQVGFTQVPAPFPASLQVSADLADADGAPADQWRLTVERLDGPGATASTPFGPSPFARLELGPAETGPALPPGLFGTFLVAGASNALRLVAEDLAGHSSVLYTEVWAFDPAVQAAVAPTFGALGAGRYAFQASLPRLDWLLAEEGGQLDVSFVVMELDAAMTPLRVAYSGLASTSVDPATGDLLASHAMAPDQALAPPAAGVTQQLLTWVDVHQPRHLGGEGVSLISVPVPLAAGP